MAGDLASSWRNLFLFRTYAHAQKHSPFAAVISGTIAVYVGWKFNFYTGTHTAAFGYFGISFLLFLAVYAVYFVVTYVGFCRNVLNEKPQP